MTYEDLKHATIICLRAVLLLFFWLFIFWAITRPARAATILTASWYSEESLRKEGTWKTSSGIMANGLKFDETDYTCATRLYPLGTIIKITNPKNQKTVYCEVTDRIGKRFAETRIDLSKAAFQKIAALNDGLVQVIITEE